jgi:DNA (cytosine-5)-methyltransferase 1
VDLFCGAGGLSLGLRRAGLDIVSAVDCDPDSCKTYRANHPTVRLLVSDIAEISAEDLLGNETESLTVLAGCPPCQGFTRLNETFRRQDPRNKLVLEYIRLVRELKPLVVFFENVPGLLNNGAWYFSRLISALTDEGFSLNWKLLQVADFGVPQRRKRLIVLGGRGFQPTFPKATHGRNPDARAGTQRKWRTVRQALRGLGRAKCHAAVRREGADPSPHWHVSRFLGEEMRQRLRATPKSGGSRADVSPEFELACHVGLDGFHDVYGRLDWNLPSVTITSGCTNLSKGRFGHPDLLRAITPREAALLQGFPKSYKFFGRGIDSVCEQIGNALPPLFAQKIASHVLGQLRQLGLIGIERHSPQLPELREDSP